ncbi:MAG: hypothetical protein IPJ19_03185 [Planctomycetes bacterium]|nr:hypothetical protein [Planctomycetota bacterium]
MSRLSLSLAGALAVSALCSPSFALSLPRCTWLPKSPAQSPSPRAAMASAYDPSSAKLVIFGGYDAGAYLQETWTYDGLTWTQEQPSLSPTARAAASMAYDATQGTLVLFGGYDGATHLGDTWIWDSASATWTQGTPTHHPTGVSGPMLFTDPANGHADMYGGYSGQFYQLTTWRWTGTDWQTVPTAHTPSARAAAVVALDRAAHEVVLFGGLASVNPWNTWTFDGSDWTLRSPAQQPPNRYNSRGAFDGALGHVVLFGGGAGGAAISDSWQWTGSNWEELQPVHSPTPRESFAMEWFPPTGSIVLFGGENGGGQLGDTRWFVARP